MSDGEEGGEFITLVSNRGAAKPPETKDDPGDGIAYGCVKGQRTANLLRLIRRQGKPVTIPYAFLPIVWGDWLPHLVLIEWPGLFTARLAAGCDLGPLEARIADYRVTWIRECDAAEVAALPLAVTRIDLIRYYPSREVAGDPRAAPVIEPEPPPPAPAEAVP